MSPTSSTNLPPLGWWEATFDYTPLSAEAGGHRCGQHQMLTLIAYDIADAKRLQRVARVCENHGMRVQYSIFECRLEAEAFDVFWKELSAEIDPEADRIAAYSLCLRCARRIRDAGVMTHFEKVVAYIC